MGGGEALGLLSINPVLLQRTTRARARPRRLYLEIAASASDSQSSGAAAVPLACPICYSPLPSYHHHLLTCQRCNKQYPNNGAYLDLTVTSTSRHYTETMPAATELFRTPSSLFSMRGAGAKISSGAVSWPSTRVSNGQTLSQAYHGHGIGRSHSGCQLREWTLFQGFLSKVASFLKSSPWTSQKICCVSAVTFFWQTTSQNMLVRADISRLPFPSGSIDAVHAGAALHCWPSPATAVAEISRVLRPGGVFVATTFIIDLVPPAVPFLRLTRQYIAQFTSNTIYVSETELEDLCRACGLVDFTCVRNGFFVMISANKPGLSRTAADMQ